MLHTTHIFIPSCSWGCTYIVETRLHCHCTYGRSYRFISRRLARHSGEIRGTHSAGPTQNELSFRFTAESSCSPNRNWSFFDWYKNVTKASRRETIHVFETRMESIPQTSNWRVWAAFLALLRKTSTCNSRFLIFSRASRNSASKRIFSCFKAGDTCGIGCALVSELT